MDGSGAFAPSVLKRWRRRENLLPGLALLTLAAASWACVAYQASTMGGMGATGGVRIGIVGGFVPFLLGWTAMMVDPIPDRGSHPDTNLRARNRPSWRSAPCLPAAAPSG